ncbi:hypothetical protein ACJVC5_13565 [Peredibacter sp. HCB2-198]|uniref:hypothetical protein n=1 Tax=Peredibacter sp. HCB2-198 TaxID=3383025 RepID=UPI0038B52C97
MKLILALVLILSFTSAFAGGQTGSGMNGCWIKNFHGVREWRSIEEVMYPEMIVKRPRGTNRSYDSATQWFYVPTTRYYDMTQRYFARRAYKRLAFIAQGHPKSHQLFSELYKLFSQVQVSTLTLNGLFKAELSENHTICKSFSPAMLTYKNGSIVVFKNVFERLDPLSAEILYIHETIRFAQTFHPAFYDLTDAELQRLTSLFFINRPNTNKFDEVLKKYEERLVVGAYKKGHYRPDLNMNSTESVFRVKFQEAILFNEEKLGDELNELRINDKEFEERSYQQTFELLQSANRQN